MKNVAVYSTGNEDIHNMLIEQLDGLGFNVYEREFHSDQTETFEISPEGADIVVLYAGTLNYKREAGRVNDYLAENGESAKPVLGITIPIESFYNALKTSRKVLVEEPDQKLQRERIEQTAVSKLFRGHIKRTTVDKLPEINEDLEVILLSAPWKMKDLPTVINHLTN